MIRVRRDVTRPYSAATKNPFTRLEPRGQGGSSLNVICAHRRTRTGRIVIHANQFGEYNDHSDDNERMFILVRCRWSTGSEPCKVAPTRVRGMPFEWS